MGNGPGTSTAKGWFGKERMKEDKKKSAGSKKK